MRNKIFSPFFSNFLKKTSSTTTEISSPSDPDVFHREMVAHFENEPPKPVCEFNQMNISMLKWLLEQYQNPNVIERKISIAKKI